MKKILFLFFIAFSFAAHAQKIKTDTVAQGNYIPLDTNVISCKVSITSGNMSSDTLLRGNLIPLKLVNKICSSRKGTVVNYYEITINRDGVLSRATSVRYVIGAKNTTPVLSDPTLPTLIRAMDLANIKVDTSYISFSVSYITEGQYISHKTNGNQLPESTKAAIRSLPSGTKVYFEQIKAKNKEGKEVKLPVVVYQVQ